MERTRIPDAGNVFISYRRDDTAPQAGRLYDILSAHFGDDRIFMDVDSIELGVDFRASVTEALSSCEVLLALVGKAWTDTLTERKEGGLDDLIRVEIKTALERGIRVIPILVNNARLPQEQELPRDLSALAHRQAFELADSTFRSDCRNLLTQIETVVSPSHESVGHWTPQLLAVLHALQDWRLLGTVKEPVDLGRLLDAVTSVPPAAAAQEDPPLLWGRVLPLEQQLATEGSSVRYRKHIKAIGELVRPDERVFLTDTAGESKKDVYLVLTSHRLLVVRPGRLGGDKSFVLPLAMLTGANYLKQGDISGVVVEHSMGGTLVFSGMVDDRAAFLAAVINKLASLRE
jgi:hypothetical protein